ncbi:HNH endonuclease [Bacillus sp. Gen3]|nr:HNH endonuclease [Bacillus sp. Gen3]
MCNDCGTEQKKRPSDIDVSKRLGCRKCMKIEAAKETYARFTEHLDTNGYTYNFTAKDLIVEGKSPKLVTIDVINSEGKPRRLRFVDIEPKKGRTKTKWTTESFMEWVQVNAPGYQLTGEFVKTKQKTSFTCPKGHVFNMTPNQFKDAGQRCPECARIAASERLSGENCHFYDPTLSDEEREALAEARRDAKYAQFRRDVLKRDNHECQVCKSEENPEVHHVYSFKAHEELRTNPNNGITLCNGCHVDFHRKYGYGDNTLEQFIDWLTNENLIATVTNRLADY